MICLGLCQSRLNVTAAIIFYTCILIPLRQLKEALLCLFGLVQQQQEQEQPIALEPYYVDLTCLEPQGINNHIYHDHHQMDDHHLPLPMLRFGELEEAKLVVEEESEVCSVCLVEFQREDEVTQLSSCGHVFHLSCIKSWVDRSRFTCPLCRSSFLLSTSTFSHNRN